MIAVARWLSIIAHPFVMARLILARHRPAEVLLGTIIGACAAFCIILL